MEAIRQYLLNVIAVSILCSIAIGFFERNRVTFGTVKLLTGLVMILCTITPVLSFEFGDISGIFDEYNIAAEEAVRVGTISADSEISAIIKNNAEAYILEKSKSLGINVDVYVHVTDKAPFVPETVEFSGNAAPYTKTVLIHWITKNLGVQEEMIQWK